MSREGRGSGAAYLFSPLAGASIVPCARRASDTLRQSVREKWISLASRTGVDLASLTLSRRVLWGASSVGSMLLKHIVPVSQSSSRASIPSGRYNDGRRWWNVFFSSWMDRGTKLIPSSGGFLGTQKGSLLGFPFFFFSAFRLFPSLLSSRNSRVSSSDTILDGSLRMTLSNDVGIPRRLSFVWSRKKQKDMWCSITYFLCFLYIYITSTASQPSYIHLLPPRIYLNRPNRNAMYFPSSVSFISE